MSGCFSHRLAVQTGTLQVNRSYAVSGTTSYTLIAHSIINIIECAIKVEIECAIKVEIVGIVSEFFSSIAVPYIVHLMY